MQKTDIPVKSNENQVQKEPEVKAEVEVDQSSNYESEMNRLETNSQNTSLHKIDDSSSMNSYNTNIVRMDDGQSVFSGVSK